MKPPPQQQAEAGGDRDSGEHKDREFGAEPAAPGDALRPCQKERPGLQLPRDQRCAPKDAHQHRQEIEPGDVAEQRAISVLEQAAERVAAAAVCRETRREAGGMQIARHLVAGPHQQRCKHSHHADPGRQLKAMLAQGDRDHADTCSTTRVGDGGGGSGRAAM